MTQFDYLFYYNFYPDLQKSKINNPHNLSLHYHLHGIYENRLKNKYELFQQTKFNPDIYQYNYEDLKKMSKNELEDHYIKFGYHEGRNGDYYFEKTINGLKFQVDYYQMSNPDLFNLKPLELYLHFEHAGYLQNRKYHPQQDLNITLNHNSDHINLIENPLPNIETPININKENTIKEEISNIPGEEISQTLEQDISNIPEEVSFSIPKFKEKHRQNCIEELPILQKIKIPYQKKHPGRETIFIEFRILPNIEFIIRNMMIKLPDWNHTIVCGKLNYKYIQEIRKNISPDLKIIHLSEIENMQVDDYSKCLTDIEFWNNFNGEKLLIYQEDTLIFHSQIEKFLEYDYVGAPWPIHQDDNSLGVGNGGFSLRSKSALIKCLEKISPKYLNYGKSTLEYMKNCNLEYYPEDVYFSKCMIDLNIGKVAPREVAIQFSQESQKSINPLGGHQFWLPEKKFILPYIKRYNLVCDYYQGVTHRGGWKTVIQNLINEKIVFYTDTLTNNISLVDCCEAFFVWEKLFEKYKLGSWIGMIHFCYNLPDFLHFENVDLLLDNEDFKSYLPSCQGIIVLSPYLKKYIQKKFPNLKIYILKHPVENINTKFSMDKFILNPHKNLIQLGYQSRMVSSIFRIRTPWKKVLLTGRKNTPREVLSRVKQEINYLKITNLNITLNNINIQYFEKNEDYDNFLTQNICIIPLWDASANNSILEIISMNIPSFVTKMESTVFYLGDNYPMFYEDLEEINNIIQHTDQFYTLILKTHQYLKNINTVDLSFQKFNSDMLTIINR